MITRFRHDDGTLRRSTCLTEGSYGSFDWVAVHRHN